MGFSTALLTCATVALACAVVLSNAQPNAPTSVEFTYNDRTSAILSWDTPTTTTFDIFGYRLKTSVDCINWPSRWTFSKVTLGTQVVVPVTEGGCLLARVRARDPRRKWSPWTRSLNYKQKYVRPDAPKNLELSAVDGQLVASWDDSQDYIESYYIVFFVRESCTWFASEQKTDYETASSPFTFPITVDVEKCYRVKVLSRDAKRGGPFAVAHYDPGRHGYPTTTVPPDPVSNVVLAPFGTGVADEMNSRVTWVNPTSGTDFVEIHYVQRVANSCTDPVWGDWVWVDLLEPHTVLQNNNAETPGCYQYKLRTWSTLNNLGSTWTTSNTLALPHD